MMMMIMMKVESSTIHIDGPATEHSNIFRDHKPVPCQFAYEQ